LYGNRVQYKPNCKRKRQRHIFHLGIKHRFFTAGCVAIGEANMKHLIHWLDSKQNPRIIMGNFEELKSGL